MMNFKQEEKHTSEEIKFKTIVENSPLAICIFSGPEQVVEYFNPTFIQLFGYTIEDIPSIDAWWPVAYPDKKYRDQIRDEWEERKRRALETNTLVQPIEALVTCKDSSIKCISWGFRSSGHHSWAFGIDMTEHRKAEEKIRLSEARLNRAELASKTGNWELHIGSQKMYASLGAVKIYGVHKDELSYAFIKNVPLSEYRPFLNKAIKDLLENDTPYVVEFKIEAADTGEIKDIYSEATFDREKGIVYGIIQDITQRKKVDESIMESARLFSNIFYNSPAALAISTPDQSKIIDVNETFLHQLEYTRDEVIGKTVAELRLFAENGEREKVIDILKKENQILGHESCFRTKSGKLIFGLISIVYVQIKGMPHLLTTVIDITERIEAEEKIRDQYEELRRWHDVTLNRENRVIELKHEVNELLVSIGKPIRYASVANELNDTKLG
jgi:PAS domain S-box-containing protein